MKNNTSKKDKVIVKTEKELKKELNDARDSVYGNADVNFDLLMSIVKKFEKEEYMAVMQYYAEYPKEKSTNPYRRYIALYKNRIKVLEAEYIKYLKKHNIKAPKNINVDKGVCKIKTVEQVKKFK